MWSEYDLGLVDNRGDYMGQPYCEQLGEYSAWTD